MRRIASAAAKSACGNDLDAVVAHCPRRRVPIALAHHQTPGENADPALQNAHVYVHFKASYTLALKQGLGEGYRRHIGGANKLFHKANLGAIDRSVEPFERDEVGVEQTVIKPQDRLIARFETKLAAVDGLIRARMESRHAPRIPEVTAHLVGGGGKRLRPMLTLAAADICGYQGSHDEKLAATVEFIHTATLLHDDVVDESEQRRGRATANLLWDNKSSILVGDYLFARSFQLMVETGNLRVLDILANASATIAEGEVLQLSAARDLATDEGVYLQIVRGKTAALFSAATEVGGVIAGAAEDQTKALFQYGDALGIAFQIADDLLDFQGDAAATGKNIGDDFRERKLTLPIIKAVAKADAKERVFWQRTIEKGDQQEGDLDHAIALMQGHGALDAARRDAFAWATAAGAALELLPEHPVRDILGDLANYVVSRIA